MLGSCKELIGIWLKAQDGDIGRCQDFLFDDEKWAIRYMVADTSAWLPKQQILISPIALGVPDWQLKYLPVQLSRAQIADAPRLDEDAPISRQYERQYASYYGYRPYWRGPSLWGVTEFPEALYEDVLEDADEISIPQGDPHLRSVDEVIGYHIQATDGTFGHIEDVVVDQETWKIHYLAIDTRNWFPSRKVIVSPDWIQNVDWVARRVKVPLTKEQIRSAPEYDPHSPENHSHAGGLFD